jgi:hypothetical protein
VSLILILPKRHPPQKTHPFYTVAFFEQKCRKQKFHEQIFFTGYYIFLVSVGLGATKAKDLKNTKCAPMALAIDGMNLFSNKKG